jgi:hypothetical protein
MPGKVNRLFIYQSATAVIIAAFAALAIYNVLPDSTPFNAISETHSDYHARRIMLWLFAILVFYAVFKLLVFRKSLPKGMLALDSAILTYIFCEFIFSLANAYKSADLYVASNHIVIPDSISDFRYLPGTHRHVYLFNGRTVFDSRFRANPQGYPSQSEYESNKLPGVERYIVLGDSYSASTFNPVSWVDMLNTSFAKDTIEPRQFYSFSLEGIGIAAWYNIFFKEVIIKYDFDAVILPVYYEDLFRRHTILYEERGMVNCAYTDSLPGDLRPENLTHNFSHWTIAPTSDSDKIDYVIDSLGKQHSFAGIARLYLLNNFVLPAVTNVIYETGKLFPVHVEQLPSNKALTYIASSKEGAKGLQELTEIVDYCKQHGKQVILCSIPDEHVNDVNNNPAFLNENSIIAALASHYGVHFFSGYKCFKFMKYSDVPQYFYADGHWNEKGSAVFANALHEYLVNAPSQIKP